MPDTGSKKLDTVNRFLQMNISKEDQFQEIVELAATICEAPVAMITFMDHQMQHIKFKVGTDLTEVANHDTFCKHTIELKELLVIPDTEVDDRVMDNPFVINDPHVRFYAGSPLTTHDDYNIGTLCIFDLKPKILTEIQKKMLHRLSRQVTRLLEFDASLELLKEQHAYSLTEETKFRSFFESSSSCHLLLDTQLRVLSFNSTMVNVLRNSYKLEIEEGMEAIDYVEPLFLAEFIRNCKSALLGEIINLETVINSPNGTVPWLLNFEPAFDSAGTIIGVTYSATDITQTIRHEKTVVEQGESLKQIDRILSADFHQPMEIIKGAMANIKKQVYPDQIIEFELLEKACDELSEKANSIISADKINNRDNPASLGSSMFQVTSN